MIVFTVHPDDGGAPTLWRVDAGTDNPPTALVRRRDLPPEVWLCCQMLAGCGVLADEIAETVGDQVLVTLQILAAEAT